MELHLSKKSKKTLKLEVVNPDETVLYPLISRLLKDKRVVDARYITRHPSVDKPTILVKVKNGEPQDVIREAALDLADRYGELRKQVQESTKVKKAAKK